MEKIKQIIRDELKNENNISLCILYGSAATGRMTKQSDVDLAIAGKEMFDLEYLADLQVRLSLNLGYEVDLVDMNRIEGLILKEILKNGIVLIKKNSSIYADFIRKAIYFDSDVLPNIRMILKHRAEKFARGH